MYTINIKGIKAEVLVALYNNAEPRGHSVLQYRIHSMTLKDANYLLKTKHITNFDYLNGRCMKVDLTTDELDPRLYNLEYGLGTAEKLINKVKRQQEGKE